MHDELSQKRFQRNYVEIFDAIDHAMNIIGRCCEMTARERAQLLWLFSRHKQLLLVPKSENAQNLLLMKAFQDIKRYRHLIQS